MINFWLVRMFWPTHTRNVCFPIPRYRLSIVSIAENRTVSKYGKERRTEYRTPYFDSIFLIHFFSPLISPHERNVHIERSYRFGFQIGLETSSNICCRLMIHCGWQNHKPLWKLGYHKQCMTKQHYYLPAPLQKWWLKTLSNLASILELVVTRIHGQFRFTWSWKNSN